MGKDCIRVCCRFRPQNKLEKSLNCHRCIAISDCKTVVEIKNPAVAKPYRFNLDHIFDTDSSQPYVFTETVKELVSNVMRGFNCTVFAYGQTGTGKTYSMEGELGSPSRGIIPRVVEFIFQLIEEADEVFEFVLKVSYCEIYLERLRDLFNPSNKQLKIRESKHGIYIQGVTEMYVRDEPEVMKLMIMGADARTVQSTRMNAVSSRSHAVFMLKLESKHTETGSMKASKLLMVDLAGSEKVAKTEASGSALEEAKKINQSLSALGNVMNALTEGSKHIPYRDSVLTKLLSDSLGGNCKTCLLIAASCSSYSAEETISTMRFGVRAKKIKNTAKVNAEKTVAEYKKEVIGLNRTISKLRKLVACLKHDLELSKKGELTEENELAAKLERGEKVDMKGLVKEEAEEKKDAPKEVTFGGAKKSTAKPKNEKPEGTSKQNVSNGATEATAEVKEQVGQEKGEQNTSSMVPASPFNPMGVPPQHMKPTADAGVFSIGDRITDVKGRFGVVQRVFYIEDVDVRWDNETVTYKIPAPKLTIVELEDEMTNNEKNVSSSISDGVVEKTKETRSKTAVLEKVSSTGNMVRAKATLERSESSEKQVVNGGAPMTAEVGEITETDFKELEGKPDDNGKSSDSKPSKSLPSNANLRKRDSMKKTKTEKEIWAKYKKATRLALSLQKEIDSYRLQGNKQKETTQKVMDKIQSVEMELNIKGEALQVERLKTEEAEAECTKAVLKLRALEDTHSTVTYEKKKLEREVLELNHHINNQEQERKKLKGKFELLKKEAENELNKVRREEKKRAEKFIEAAQKAIKRSSQPVKRLMRENERMQRNRTKKTAQNSITIQPENKSDNSEMFKELQCLKLQQLKLEQDLSNKVNEFIELKIKLAEKEDELGHMQNSVKNKDLRLKHQHDELAALGKLKIESDKYHSEKAARDQQRILKLKRIISKSKRKKLDDSKAKGHISKKRQKNMRAVVVPLRGGGGSKKKKKKASKKKKKSSPTGSVASSYVSKSVPHRYDSALNGVYSALDDRHVLGMMEAGSEYKHEVDDVGSQVSFGSYAGRYYSQTRHNVPIYEEDLPEIPTDDVESSIDGYSVTGYSAGNQFDTQSWDQYYPNIDMAQPPQTYSYQYGNSYAPYAGSDYMSGTDSYYH